MVAVWRPIALASACVLAGTLLGTRLLARLPERAFRRVLAVVLLALAAWMLVGGGGR
jgi:uncharacterized membrane protein YfcA